MDKIRSVRKHHQSERASSTKTIGILGGMGPATTVDFYRRITELTRAAYDQEHLHILIDSCPFVPDRTAFLVGEGENPVRQY